jgi:hypothetical protein
VGLTTPTLDPDACPGCGAPGKSDALCFRCHAQASATLAAIRAGQIPPGSVRASVCPDGARCSRCRIPHRWLTPAYWDPAKRFCASCCGIVAAELDGEQASWPPQPLEGARADAETFPPSGERTEAHSAPPPVSPSPAEPVVVPAPHRPGGDR